MLALIGHPLDSSIIGFCFNIIQKSKAGRVCPVTQRLYGRKPNENLPYFALQSSKENSDNKSLIVS